MIFRTISQRKNRKDHPQSPDRFGSYCLSVSLYLDDYDLCQNQSGDD